VQTATLLVRPPYVCDGDFVERTETVCAVCAPSNPVNYYNQFAARSFSVRSFANIQFVCGFGLSEPCGPNPLDATFCRFELTVYANTVLNCPAGPVQATGGGIVYIKKCCNYAEGPLGTYVLRDDPSSGNYTDANDCRVFTQTMQASPTAIVTRAS